MCCVTLGRKIKQFAGQNVGGRGEVQYLLSFLPGIQGTTSSYSLASGCGHIISSDPYNMSRNDVNVRWLVPLEKQKPRKLLHGLFFFLPFHGDLRGHFFRMAVPQEVSTTWRTDSQESHPTRDVCTRPAL